MHAHSFPYYSEEDGVKSLEYSLYSYLSIYYICCYLWVQLLDLFFAVVHSFMFANFYASSDMFLAPVYRSHLLVLFGSRYFKLQYIIGQLKEPIRPFLPATALCVSVSCVCLSMRPSHCRNVVSGWDLHLDRYCLWLLRVDYLLGNIMANIKESQRVSNIDRLAIIDRLYWLFPGFRCSVVGIGDYVGWWTKS